MTTYGPKNPQNIQWGAGTGGWTNQDNAKVTDGTAATAEATSTFKPRLTPTKFQLDVLPPKPANITLRFRRKAAVVGVTDDVIQLFRAGVVGPNISAGAAWATDWEDVSYTFTDLSALTATDMNLDAFGARIQASGVGTVFVDGITLEAAD